MLRQRIRGKMRNYGLMNQHQKLQPYLLESRWFTPETLKSILQNYNSVFVKPNRASRGNGIIQIRRVGNSLFNVNSVNREALEVDDDALLSTVRSRMLPKKRYLIQQGIELTRFKGDPFDVRVIVQKPKRKWEIAGMVARVAAPNQFVTNYHKGGHGIPVEEAMEHIQEKYSIRSSLTEEISDLSQLIAEHLGRNSKVCERGIDIGIDPKGNLWIIEAGTGPR